MSSRHSSRVSEFRGVLVDFDPALRRSVLYLLAYLFGQMELSESFLEDVTLTGLMGSDLQQITICRMAT